MAIVPAAQVQILYNQGGTDLIAKFAVRNVQSGDTIDLSITGVSPPFAFVRFATVMSFSANKVSLATASGTVITMPTGLPPNSSVYLDVGGCL